MEKQHLHLQHLHTSGSTGPDVSLLYEGELAVSMSGTSTGLWTRDNDGNVVKVGRTESELKDIVVRDIAGSLSDLSTSAKTTLVDSINEVCDTVTEDELVTATALVNLHTTIGELSALTTSAKTDIVSAINVVDGRHVLSDLTGKYSKNNAKWWEDRCVFDSTSNYDGTFADICREGDLLIVDGTATDTNDYYILVLQRVHQQQAGGKFRARTIAFSKKSSVYRKQEVDALLDAIRTSLSGITKEMVDDEEVVATALTNLDARLNEVSGTVENVYDKTTVDNKLDVKVDKVSGKGLSTNDYTTEEKEKLASLEKLWESGSGEHSVQTVGTNSQALGDCSVAEGAETDAHSYASHAEGYMTSTGEDADYSHAEGYKTSTQGVASHAEGDNTVTNNPAEHAEGKYNKSNMGGTSATNTLHSIGIGNGSGSIPGGERKNAVEVMENGDQYIIGVGGYDGKDIVSSSTLQEVIASKADNASLEEIDFVVSSALNNLNTRLETVSGSVETKQETLQSGVNIKTINGNSVLGSGNIEIQGGGGGVEQSYVDEHDAITLQSANAYTNQSVSGKADSEDVYTKEDADERFITSGDVYTKLETDSKVAQSLVEAKDYASGYTYSSDDIDEMLSDKANSGDVETLVEEAIVMAQGYIDSKLEEKQDVLESYIKSARVDGNTLLLTPNTGADISFTPTGGGGYVDKEYVDAQDRATLNSANTYTDEAVSSKANSSDVYTKSATDDLLDGKANASEVYSKSETDSKVAKSLTDAKEYASGYTYSKDETDVKYALIGASYTKSEEDGLLGNKASKSDVEAAIESAKTFTTQSVSGKANSADVYPKSETYTKLETDSAITSAVTSAIQGKLHFEVAPSLPTSGDGSTIYLIPKVTGETQNQYDEYAWVNDSWELIGVASVDLSQYALKTDVSGVSARVDTAESNITTLQTSVTNIDNRTTSAENKITSISGSVNNVIDDIDTLSGTVSGISDTYVAKSRTISGITSTIGYGDDYGQGPELRNNYGANAGEALMMLDEDGVYIQATKNKEVGIYSDGNVFIEGGKVLINGKDLQKELEDVEYTVAQAIAELKAQIQYLMNNR